MTSTIAKPEYDIFLSDIHIGIDASTNLYQSTKDQPALKAILKHIQESGNIRNIVILGDWIDLWMYRTSATPNAKARLPEDRETLLPSVKQIFTANPDVFCKQTDGSGDFVTCIERISGSLHYVNGNHDITATPEEINGFLPSGVHKPILCHRRTYSEGQVYAEHGHYYSMTCKPTEKPGLPLPLGYFITRAGADQGIKQPQDITQILEYYRHKGYSFSKSILMATCSEKKDDLAAYENLRFRMPPDGKTLTAREVELLFPDEPGFNLRAFENTDMAMADPNFLKEKANAKADKAHPIALMGHTHAEYESPLDKPRIEYLNTGFLCGDQQKPSTFAKVSVGAGQPQATMYEVVCNQDHQWVIRKKA